MITSNSPREHITGTSAAASPIAPACGISLDEAAAAANDVSGATASASAVGNGAAAAAASTNESARDVFAMESLHNRFVSAEEGAEIEARFRKVDAGCSTQKGEGNSADCSTTQKENSAGCFNAAEVENSGPLTSIDRADWLQERVLEATDRPTPARSLQKINHPKRRQIINVAYFGLSSTVILAAAVQLHSALFGAVSLMFLCLASLALLVCLLDRACPSSTDELPVWVRRTLRAVVLIAPMPIMFASGSSLICEAELKRADALCEQDRYAQATLHYAIASYANPFSDKPFTGLAHTYNMCAEYDQALRTAQRAFTLNPISPEASIENAIALTKLGRARHAVGFAERAVALDAKNGWAWSVLGDARRDSGDYEGALDAFTQHALLHPHEAKVYEDRATVLSLMGRAKESNADMDYAKLLKRQS